MNSVDRHLRCFCIKLLDNDHKYVYISPVENFSGFSFSFSVSVSLCLSILLSNVNRITEVNCIRSFLNKFAVPGAISMITNIIRGFLEQNIGEK